jgi:YhcH/YjgK/YiaL family protein
MIYDRLDNYKLYVKAHPLFKVAFDFLLSYKGMEIGRYDLKDGVFVLVQRYNTKKIEEARWEAHKKFIDLQFVVRGKEQIGIAKLDTLSPASEFDNLKDIGFFLGEGSFVDLTDNEFMILYPSDAHMPAIGDGSAVDKIVIKIPV